MRRLLTRDRANQLVRGQRACYPVRFSTFTAKSRTLCDVVFAESAAWCQNQIMPHTRSKPISSERDRGQKRSRKGWYVACSLFRLCTASADGHAAQNVAGVRSNVTSNSPGAVNVERPTAIADCKIRYLSNMNFRLGSLTHFKVIRETETT